MISYVDKMIQGMMRIWNDFMARETCVSHHDVSMG